MSDLHANTYPAKSRAIDQHVSLIDHLEPLRPSTVAFAHPQP